MSLKLRIDRHLDVTIMEFSGRVTLGEGSLIFRDAVRDAVWNGHRKLALDYGDVTYQDSSGLAEMVSGFTIVSNAGGELVLFDLTKKVHDLFQITKLYSVFPVYDSQESALKHFDLTRKSEVRVSERCYGNVGVLEMEGSLSEKFGVAEVLAAMRNAFTAGAKSLILLCPQVLDIDRTGAEALTAARYEAQKRGGELVMAGVEDRLMPAMSEVGVAQGIPMHKTIDEALGIFGLTVDRSRWRIEVVRAR